MNEINYQHYSEAKQQKEELFRRKISRRRNQSKRGKQELFSLKQFIFRPFEEKRDRIRKLLNLPEIERPVYTEYKSIFDDTTPCGVFTLDDLYRFASDTNTRLM